MGARVKRDQKKLEEQLARALADYDNLVKRAEREKGEVVLRATKRLVEDLLPIIDGLERAEEHLKDEGLRMALEHFYSVLGSHGVEEIPVKLGDKFDSDRHEVIEIIEGGKRGTIAKVLFKGYRWLDGTVLRPVKVQVYGEEPEKEKELDKEMTRGDYV